MATAPTPSNQATKAATTINSYLKYAATKPYAILGSVPEGSAGGSNANVNWQQQIPIIPAFCTAVEFQVNLPVTLTLPASGTATLSPFAPYSAVLNQLTIAGAPPWPLMEMTPWYFDSTFHRVGYDPNYPGLGGNAGYFAAVLDQGPTPQNIGGSGSLAPGSVVTNSGTSAASTNYVFQFNVRMQLQRKRHLLWGAIPFGDPENRPYNLTQVAPLIGSNPEQSLFVQASSGATCDIGTGGATFNCIYELSYIDLLPDGSQAAPQPTVDYGLQVSPSTTTGLSAGSIIPITHRTAMAYTAIHHVLVNDQAPLRADYFALWDDQDQQSARWSYDSQNNTFQDYFTRFHRINRRYPHLGVYTAEFDDGVFPEIPSVTPYDAIMSPDKGYASAFGIPVTPAMTTALRIPSSVTVSSPYIRNYEFGLVKVPY
jgi:hypothetical protein